MILPTILIALIISFMELPVADSYRYQDVSKLVKDVIENEQVPSVLWAKTCWPKIDDFNFVRSFEIPMQIVKSNSPINLMLNGITNKLWFFIDMNCEASFDFLMNTQDTYFTHPYRWIIVDASNDSIENLAFLPGSNVILANQQLNSAKYELRQAYKIGKDDPLIYEEFGLWSYKSGFVDSRTSRILSKRRRNLRGHRLIAPTVFIQKGSENYTDLDDYHHNRIDTISKLSYVISKHWVESMNATMEGDVHRTWGYKDKKTGEITGLSGQLQRKEADIGGTIIFMTIDRIDYLDYLSMTIPSTIAFVLRSPPISYVSNIYYLPFTGTVWLCSIALVVLCTVVIALTLKFHLKSGKETEHLKMSDYFLFAVASACQMGTDIITKVLSTRISMFFFYIALLFIYTSFTANIVALLQSTTKSIRTISDLQNPAIDIGVHDTPFNRYYFAEQTEASRKTLYETKVAPANGPDAYMNLSYGISEMRKGMFAFHVSTGQGYDEVERTFLEYEKCGLVEIPFLGNVDTWSVIQKQSPYKEILKVNIMKIREHGIQTRERARIYKMRPKCDSDGKNFGSVRLIDCYAALLILVYGFVASFAIFCVEKFIKSKLSTICATKRICFEENWAYILSRETSAHSTRTESYDNDLTE